MFYMFTSRTFRFFIVSIALTFGLTSYFLLPTSSFAQVDPCTTNISGQSRSALEEALEACNADIAKWTKILNNAKNESASFANDVAYLTAKIKVAQTNIKAKNIAIANLGKDISSKQTTINSLDNKIERGRASLAEILRKTSLLDEYSLPETILSNKDFSEFFVDVNAYSAMSLALEDVFAELRGVKAQTQIEKEALRKKQDEEANARAAIELAKKQVEISQAQKKTLLAESQNKEKTYGQVLAERQAKAAQIRAVLFPLRDAGAISFGMALQYAEQASKVTGVRPALILGILQQESNLGENVGTCVITNLTTGETKSVKSGRTFINGIHPTRDLPLLQPLLKNLGRDPLTTKVSCPQAVGYGGAMGPAQFIPSTWNIMKDKVANALNNANPDPWNPADSIMAMALFLKDLGASSGTHTSERTAACKYYSGRNCYSSSGSPNVGLKYGNEVMSKASTIQLTMIDPLQGI